MKEAILAIVLGINGILVGWNARALWEDYTKNGLGSEGQSTPKTDDKENRDMFNVRPFD